MATSNTSPNETQQSWLAALARHRLAVAYGMFALSALLALIPILGGYKYQAEYLNVCLWGAALSMIALGTGLTLRLHEPERLPQKDAFRLLVLAAGGLSGFVTVIFLGIGLAWKWWSTFAGGWEKWQSSEGWHIWVTILALMAGLAIMFVSLQLARGDEQSSSGMRRLVYGYNTVLTGLLLVLILLVVNVLVYVPWGRADFFNTTYRWADASIFSLSSQSERILEGLDKQAKIYVIMRRNDFMSRSVHALLDNCRAVTDKVQVEYLSPDMDRERVDALKKEYKFGGEDAGLLVVYGSGDSAEHRFIKRDDLTQQPDFSQRSQATIFKGEAALLGELNSMTQGKEKPVIYFTQGNGELDVTDSQPTRQFDQGAGLLKERLVSGGYKVQGLQFSPVAGAKAKSPDVIVSTRVPDDATIVVIAGPRHRFEPFVLEALRSYMEPSGPEAQKAKKGKLVAMLDVVLSPEKTMQATGLEPFLAEFGVQVGNDRILRIPSAFMPNPELVLVQTNPDRMARQRNPLADAFTDQAFSLYKCRTVKPQTAGPQPNTKYRADTLLVAAPSQQQYLWAETNLETDPRQLMEELDKRKELVDRLSMEPLPVAVTVTETQPGAGGGPHAMAPSEEKPRLIVFGDATLVSNRVMSDRSGGAYYDLVSSALAWLRERPSNIGIEPKKSDVYVLNQAANVSRMIWLPLILLSVSIVGLGTGVWVVRRR